MGFELRPLQYQCNVVPITELAVQLRAGHYGLLVHYSLYRDHEVEVQYM